MASAGKRVVIDGSKLTRSNIDNAEEQEKAKPVRESKNGKTAKPDDSVHGDYDDYDSARDVDLGEIFLELDDNDNVVASDQDPYEDAYASADFEGSVVSLIADHHSTSVAERRGILVASAKSKFESSRARCWPGCMMSRLNLVPVLKYDKILVADSAKDLVDLRRQIDGLSGFDPRELRQEIASLKDLARMGRAGDALRPISWKGGDTVTSVMDPVARHCVLPDEACDTLKISEGRFSRPKDGGGLVDLIRLLPGDRAELAEKARFDDFIPDASCLVKDLGLLSPGESDRAACDMGISWHAPFMHALRRESGKAAADYSHEAVADIDVSSKTVKRSDSPTVPSQSKPNVDMALVIGAIGDRLSKLKQPKTRKLAAAAAAAGGGGGEEEVVRVYASSEAFAKDETDERAVYGAEYDDTPRHLLKLAAKLPPNNGDTLSDRIRQVSESRLTGKIVEDVERGGKAILVGDRVALKKGDTDVGDEDEQVYMRAREAKTGVLFWALQRSRAARPPSKPALPPTADSAYPAPPTDADAVSFGRDALTAAMSRLKAADQKFVPDEALVTRVVASMTDHGHYAAPHYIPLEKRVAYSVSKTDTHETEFRPVSLASAPADASEGVSGYLELAAAALLGKLFPRGIRLPKKIEGTAWLVKIAVPEDPRYAELLDGGGSDPLRLKYLVDTSLNAAAVAVLLTDMEPDEASALLAEVDVQPFLDSSKSKEVWAAAVKKKISPDAVASAAELARARSPLLDHIVAVVERAEDRRLLGDADEMVATLHPSRLQDWNGYRPLPRDLGEPDDVPLDAMSESINRDAIAETGLFRIEEDRKSDLSTRVKAVYKKAGIPNAFPIFDAFLEKPGGDGVAALKNSALAVWAVLGMISASVKHDSVARFRSFAPADAKLILGDASVLKSDLMSRESAADAAEAWVALASGLPEEFALMAAESAASMLKVAYTDVDVLLDRMEAAKEAIKNEKIKFAESVDESSQSAMAALRNIGLQTIDDQILAFDRRNGDGVGVGYNDGEPADEGDSYETMDFYDEDDGLDYD